MAYEWTRTVRRLTVEGLSRTVDYLRVGRWVIRGDSGISIVYIYSNKSEILSLTPTGYMSPIRLPFNRKLITSGGQRSSVLNDPS
jgi:hypothetical protein